MQLFQVEEKQIADIIIEERARAKVGDITSLANSSYLFIRITSDLIDLSLITPAVEDIISNQL